MSTIVETGDPSAPTRGRRLLKYEDLRDRGIDFSKLHLWRLSRDGKFPAAVKLGHSRSAWIEDEVEAWLDERVAARDAEDDHD